MVETVDQSLASARGISENDSYNKWFSDLLTSLDPKIAGEIGKYPSLTGWSRETLIRDQLLSVVQSLERGSSFRDRLTRLYTLFEIAMFPNLNPNEQREEGNNFRMSQMWPSDRPLVIDEQLIGDLQQLWEICGLRIPTDEQKNAIPDLLKRNIVNFDSLVYQRG